MGNSEELIGTKVYLTLRWGGA